MAAIDLFFKNSKTDLHTIELNDQGTFNYVGQRDIEPYRTVTDLFGIDNGDLVVVIRAGNITKRDFLKFSHSIHWLSEANSVEIQHVIFFIEDLCYDSTQIGFIKRVCKAHDFKTVKVFHCEQDYCYDNFNLDIGYYDWYVVDLVKNIYKSPGAVDLNFSNKICCLNRRFGQHRYLASAFLSNYDSVTVTQQYGLPNIPRGDIDVNRLSMMPQITQGSEKLHQTGRLKDVNLPVETVGQFDYTSTQSIQELNLLTKQSFCSLVTESRYHSSMPNFSEKTLRVIYSGRPFILLAPAGTLKLLQDLGFKTFNEFWDESYDSESDPTARFELVMRSVQTVLDNQDLDLTIMRSLLEYNQAHISKIPKTMYDLRFSRSL